MSCCGRDSRRQQELNIAPLHASAVRHVNRSVTAVRAICAVCLAVLCAEAQDAPEEHLGAMAEWNDAINWTSALREPMRRMTNHVTSTYAIASLAAVMCPADQSIAADMFREAVTG